MAERLLALAVLVLSGAYLAAAMPLPRGAAARPGPGFFPVVVGVFACAVALAFVIRTLRGAGGTRPMEPAPPGGRRRVLATSTALIGFALLLPWAGFPIAAALFVTVVLRRLGATWTGAITTGVVAAGAAHYVFAGLLGVPLPRGAWLD